tara:strand:+ start:146 stop:304 length:159 start_codon:yes stop_codon:yes gene_type:complete
MALKKITKEIDKETFDKHQKTPQNGIHTLKVNTKNGVKYYAIGSRNALFMRL